MSVVGVAERAAYVGWVRTAGTCLGSASTGALMARPLQGAACVRYDSASASDTTSNARATPRASGVVILLGLMR